ncbi:Golgi SNAP receptor complex member 1 [Oopsacas minuta]|uniref:Golgi SNAP receptor complex member 1 n=1 Tax=Oopsacas minuta TaxID=111878 RepID=A0AAV7JVJ4_9METZ|nr:Golgi SNAP receptor complex member 1 [Oopsacas minuta]
MTHTTLRPNGRWEDLRRQVRRCEGEIESKLSSYARLVSADTSTRNLQSQSLSNELSQKLTNLKELNNTLQEYVNSQYNAPPSMLQTAERHKEVLQDYQQEFSKTAENIGTLQKREALFTLSRNRGGDTNNKSDLLLKEHEHVKHTTRMADEIINMAIDTKESLSNQRKALSGIFSTTDSISNKFPLLNRLSNKIQFKRKKDSIILGSVIAVGLIIFIFLLFR